MGTTDRECCRRSRCLTTSTRRHKSCYQHTDLTAAHTDRCPRNDRNSHSKRHKYRWHTLTAQETNMKRSLVKSTPQRHGRPEGRQEGGIFTNLDFGNVFLTVLIILAFNDKWL